MSFDLSQLDLVAKGENKKSEESTPLQKPKLKITPRISRRKSKNVRQLTQSISEDSRPIPPIPETSEDQCPESSPPMDYTSNQGVGIEVNGRQLLRKRQCNRDMDLMESSSPVKKRNTKQSRLQRLAELTDTANLPLCDLISRASYLEDRKLQQTSHQTSNCDTRTPQSSAESESLLAPQVTVVDGKLVVNSESLEVRNDKRNRSNEEYVRVEEGEDRLVNYHTYADWASTKSLKWTAEESELLVQGIGQFGIDFSLLERLFPGRGRKQIKAKFSRMWKEDPEVFGKHFNKKEGETDESYSRLVRDLRSEKLTFKSDDFQTQTQAQEECIDKEKEQKPVETEDLSCWTEQDFHY
eukprot:g3486.t1